MRGIQQVILERDAELAVLPAAAAAPRRDAAPSCWWKGPRDRQDHSAPRRLRRPGAPGGRILTARGLALESGFSYGIVRQLIEPVRAAAGPGEWDALLDGAAGLAARVFDGPRPGSVEDDVPHAVPCTACTGWSPT